MLPRPTELSTSIVPPCAWAIASAVGRPRPTPSRGPERSLRPTKKRSNSRGLVRLGDARAVVLDDPAPCGRRGARRAGAPHRAVGEKRWALATRLTSACSSRRRSPNTCVLGRDGGIEHDPLAGAGRERRHHRGGRLGERDRAKPAQLERDAAGTEARQLEDVADEPLHPIGVALDRLRSVVRCSSVGSDARVEQQADARAHGGQRRPQLVGDRRQQVGPQPLELVQRDTASPPLTGLDVRVPRVVGTYRRCSPSRRLARTRPSSASSSSRAIGEPGHAGRARGAQSAAELSRGRRRRHEHERRRRSGRATRVPTPAGSRRSGPCGRG